MSGIDQSIQGSHVDSLCPSNSGYRLMKRNVSDWVATWGKNMKPLQFRVMKEDQKVNHFPGTFHIDRLWRNYRRLLLKYGEEEFDFLPRTFCLPADDKLLRKVKSYEQSDPDYMLITRSGKQ